MSAQSMRRAPPLRGQHARVPREGPHHRALVLDDERVTRREPRDPRAVALEDELWLGRAVSLARSRQLAAAALCVSDGRLLAEAAGPAQGLAAPDLVVLRRMLGARPRHLTLYAHLSTLDPHRALAYREVGLARIVLRLRERPSEDTVALLAQRGVDVRIALP